MKKQSYWKLVCIDFGLKLIILENLLDSVIVKLYNNIFIKGITQRRVINEHVC